MTIGRLKSALEIATNLAVLVAALLVIGLAAVSMLRRKPAVPTGPGAVPAPGRVPTGEIEAADAPAIGAPNAAVTIVEFSDFECPFCEKLARTLRYQVLPDHSARVKLIYRQFPLPNHPWAEPAAEISECAAMQNGDAFWSLHDFFFQNQARLSRETVNADAVAFLRKDSRIDIARLNTCVATGLAKPRIRADVALGQRYGVHSTPTLFVNGLRIAGAPTAQRVNSLIQAAIADGSRQ